MPLAFDLDDQFRPVDDKPIEDRYLMDPAAVKAKADAVAKQASGG